MDERLFKELIGAVNRLSNSVDQQCRLIQKQNEYLFTAETNRMEHRRLDTVISRASAEAYLDALDIPESG